LKDGPANLLTLEYDWEDATLVVIDDQPKVDQVLFLRITTGHGYLKTFGNQIGILRCRIGLGNDGTVLDGIAASVISIVGRLGDDSEILIEL
jgi:hypothetical protein